MRNDCYDWDTTYMGLATLIAHRSKDPNTQVGACVVNKLYQLKSIGYNGFPRNVSNDKFSWSREGGFLDTKYAYMCHAESNAIDNIGRKNK